MDFCVKIVKLQLIQSVAEDKKLKMFRESLKLFMNHFLLKNLEDDQLNELKSRIKIAEKALKSSGSY